MSNGSEKKRILFVDDEQAVLEGMEDRFISDSRRWELLFASSGEAALCEMQKKLVDVIVSDMRMPGMDGAELLARVQADYPATARIVLTGQAERDAVLRAMSVAHQFLSKPCDTNALRTAIERTCGLQQTVQNPMIRGLVGGLKQVPSAPKVYSRLTQAAADPNAGISDFAEIVASDPTMGAKVLQLTNSAYFGLRQSVTSIHQAVSYLGIELLKGLALIGDLFASSSAVQLEGCSVETLQGFALLTARVAKRLLPDKHLAEEAFTAGLVHDIGRFVLAQGMPAEYAAIVREALADNRPVRTVEKEKLGTTHAEVGAYLLGVWGLPFAIVESVAHHHEPSRVTTGDRQVLAAVHAADGLVDAALDRTTDRNSLLDLEFLKQAGFGDKLQGWHELAEAEVASLKQAA